MTSPKSPAARTAAGRSTATSIDLSKRDLTLDLARVVCVLLVVVIHLLEIGVGANARTGALQITRPLEMQGWFPYGTWIGQIMPLFFVVGGFASLTSWRSLGRRGGDGPDYVKNRILRLAQPAFPLFVFYSVVITAATGLVLAGVIGQDFVDGVVGGAGSPLWFIAAYAICQALVPWLATLHVRAPKRTVLVMFVGVIAVDALRYGTGIEQLGYLNMLLVWPLIQQFGFWYADGWFDRRRWWQLVLMAVLGVAALAPLAIPAGGYSLDMLTNLNPPTLPLVFLGVSQAAFLRLMKRPLTALMRTTAAKGVVFLVGTRLMTIYLWHLPIIIIFTGIALLIPGANPPVESPAWWYSRILVFVLGLGALFALSLLVGRWEAPREVGETPPVQMVALAAILTIAPPFLIIEYQLGLVLAIVGAVSIGVAILILGRWGVRLAERIDLHD